MTVKSTAVTVAVTATRLDTVGEQWDGSSVAFFNNGSQTIYTGGSDVTTANGAPVPPGTWSPSIESGKDGVYGIVAATTAEARVLEAGI